MLISQNLREDTSVKALVASNLFTIVLALAMDWHLTDIMWIYWGQSVIIGLFNFLRILGLEQFSTEGFKINGRAVEPTPSTRRQTAWFFLLHYGLFHFVYCIFLAVMGSEMPASAFWGIVVCVLVFAGNHGFSYLRTRERDRERRPNIGTIMFFPYARIIPMHLTIVFGMMLDDHSWFSLIWFLGLKTLADLIMHLVEHAEKKAGAEKR